MDKVLATKAYLRQQARKASDYFKPTENVRVRDFVREVPGAVGQLFSGTRDTFVKGGKILGEGAAYATDKNVRDQYKAGNTEILPTVSNTTPRQMLANTGKAGLELAPVGKIKGLASAAMSARLAPRMAAGGAMGYGYGVADEMSKPGPINRDTFLGVNPVMSALAGALLGGASRPAAEMTGQSLREMGNDIRNINPKNRMRHEVVNQHQWEPVPGVFAPGGVQQMRQVPDTMTQSVKTTVDPFEPKSYLARVLMGKQSPVGMTIAGVKPDANGQFPTGSFSARFDKKPRIEIGDEGAFSPTKIDKEYGAFVDDSGKFPKTVGELFKHDELFNRYPELKNIEISQYNGRINGDMNTGGSYDPVANRISLNLENIKDKERLKSTLLHEIQHAIQQKEGFARGGVPNDYFESRKPIIKKLEKESQLLQRELDRVATGRYAGQKKKIDEVVKRIQANDSALKEAGLESKPGDAFNYYQRLGGELESRSVQRRMNMTPKERLSSDPYAAEAKATGIKGVDDVITRFDDGVANSVDPLLQEARKYNSAEEFVKAQGDTLYHGTPYKFDEFQNGRTTFFTPDKSFAEHYGSSKSAARGMDADVKILERYGKLNLFDSKNPEHIKKIEKLLPNDVEILGAMPGFGGKVPKKEFIERLQGTFTHDTPKFAKEAKKVGQVFDDMSIKHEGQWRIKEIKKNSVVAEKIDKWNNNKVWRTEEFPRSGTYKTTGEPYWKDFEGDKSFEEAVKKAGFDGYKMTERDKPTYGIFDTAKLKTKSQLTDLWKKATKK